MNLVLPYFSEIYPALPGQGVYAIDFNASTAAPFFRAGGTAFN